MQTTASQYRQYYSAAPSPADRLLTQWDSQWPTVCETRNYNVTFCDRQMPRRSLPAQSIMSYAHAQTGARMSAVTALPRLPCSISPPKHPLEYSPSRLKYFQAHFKKYRFVLPTGHDLALSWLFRTLEYSVIQIYLLTYFTYLFKI